MSRALVANVLNDVMAECPTAPYRAAMASVTPRKLWIARPGDCVVLTAPYDDEFRAYVESVRDVSLADVDVVHPAELYTGHVLDLVNDFGVAPRVTNHDELMPFVLDERMLRFSIDHRMSVSGYQSVPDKRVVDLIRALNTKRGFRDVATNLGLKVADGGYAQTVPSLIRSVQDFLRDHENVIVKRNRSSNGWGNVVVGQEFKADVSTALEGLLSTEDGCREEGWIFEEFLDFESLPSMELMVDESGPRRLYSCSQRSVNNAWTGMVTPFDGIADARPLWLAAEKLGDFLWRSGFRGVFDLDGGLVDGQYYVTEANVRRTGGTYLHELVSELMQDSVCTHWRADVRPGRSDLSFSEACRRLEGEGLAPTRGANASGAVLTVNTRSLDGKWRYLVYASTPGRAEALEAQVTDMLGI